MISIIVPVYNVEAFLPQCLDSLIRQTYRDLEIICVNDGSTDGSLGVLEEYAKKDIRIRLISRENRGASESRNEAIDVARGEWLMFVDSDDWLEEACCESVLKEVQGKDLTIFSYIREFRNSSEKKFVIGEHRVIYEKDNVNGLLERLIAPESEPDKLDSLSTIWGKLYRADIIKDNHLSFVSTKEIGTLEDLLFNVAYFRYIERAEYLPTCYYHYRKINQSSLSNSYKSALDVKWRKVWDIIESSISPSEEAALLDALERRKALSLLGLGLNITFKEADWKEKYLALEEILTSDWYAEAIGKLPVSELSLHWRLFYTLAKKKQTTGVLCMLLIMNKIINR